MCNPSTSYPNYRTKILPHSCGFGWSYSSVQWFRLPVHDHWSFNQMVRSNPSSLYYSRIVLTLLQWDCAKTLLCSEYQQWSPLIVEHSLPALFGLFLLSSVVCFQRRLLNPIFVDHVEFSLSKHSHCILYLKWNENNLNLYLLLQVTQQILIFQLYKWDFHSFSLDFHRPHFMSEIQRL